MKKILATLLIAMAVLSVSAMAADYFPAWWETMQPGEKMTGGQYSVMTAVAEDCFTPLTANSQLTYSTAGASANIKQTLSTDIDGQQTGIDRQLAYQGATAYTTTKTGPKYDSENANLYFTADAGFTTNQWASFSGDLSSKKLSDGCDGSREYWEKCGQITYNDPHSNSWTHHAGTPATPATYEAAAFTVNFNPGSSYDVASVNADGITVRERQFGDSASVSVFNSNVPTRLIEAYAGQATAAEATKFTQNTLGTGSQTYVTLDGSSQLLAGFQNAIMPAGHTNEIAINLDTSSTGDHFWWE